MAAIQTGTEYKVSFGSAAYENLTLTSVKESKGTYNEEKIPTEAGATDSIIDMDPYVQFDIEGVVKAADVAVIAKNAIVTFTPPAGSPTGFRCESMAKTHITGATRVSMTIIREASMAAIYDA